MYTRCPDNYKNQPTPPENYNGTFIDKMPDRPPPEMPECEPPCHEPPELPCTPDKQRKDGILGGLLGKFGNFELDDLLLLGLIFLLVSNRSDESENSDDLLLILGLLLFMGN